jgi:hypothetical protein
MSEEKCINISIGKAQYLKFNEAIE